MSNANFNTSNVNLNPGLASSVQTPDQQFGKNPFKDPVTGGGQPFFMGNMNPYMGSLTTLNQLNVTEPQTPVAMQAP